MFWLHATLASGDRFSVDVTFTPTNTGVAAAWVKVTTTHDLDDPCYGTGEFTLAFEGSGS